MKKLKSFERFMASDFMMNKKLLVGALQPRKGANGGVPDDGYPYVLKGFIIADPDHDGANQGQALDVKLKSIEGLKVNQTLTFGTEKGQATLVKPVATVWGDFRNNLSLKADKIVAVREGSKS